MNAVLENIMTRRSCRAFEKRHIPKEDLEKILTAAVYAPTAMNRQTWRFTVLTDEKKIAELAVAVGRAISRADYDFYKPDALVIVSNLREKMCIRDRNRAACAASRLCAWRFPAAAAS